MISRIAAVHSVAPIISDPIYGPKTLNSQLVNGLLVTSGMMPSAPGAVILNLPAHSNITIIPMLQTRKGIFRSATNAAIFVRTLFACDASADVGSVIKGLLHVMIHGCQRLKADLNRDFRFGLLSRASYASPAFDDNELIVCKRRMGVYSEHWWLKIKNPHYAQTGDATRCLRRLGNIARTTNLPPA